MSLEDRLAAIISPHLPSGQGWCSTCKIMVMSSPRHVAEALIRAGVEIPTKTKKSNALNFMCPGCGAVEGEACKPAPGERQMKPGWFHAVRGRD